MVEICDLCTLSEVLFWCVFRFVEGVRAVGLRQVLVAKVSSGRLYLVMKEARYAMAVFLSSKRFGSFIMFYVMALNKCVIFISYI